MIGVFDSGVGGLSVLKELVRELPQYDYCYLGDTARAPYGPRSSEEVYRYTLEAVEFLFKQGCELIVIACNTASAEALRRIQQRYLSAHYPNRRVLGVIVPASEEAASATRNGKVGVIATEGTVRSSAFVREIQKLRPGTTVFQQAAPMLVSIVEAGNEDSSAAQDAVRSYLEPLLAQDIDTLVLGCTHYEHLLPEIESFIDGRAAIVSEGAVVARALHSYLERHPEFARPAAHSPQRLFNCTGDVAQFARVGSKFFGSPLTPTLIRLEPVSGAV